MPVICTTRRLGRTKWSTRTTSRSKLINGRRRIASVAVRATNSTGQMTTARALLLPWVIPTSTTVRRRTVPITSFPVQQTLEWGFRLRRPRGYQVSRPQTALEEATGAEILEVAVVEVEDSTGVAGVAAKGTTTTPTATALIHYPHNLPSPKVLTNRRLPLPQARLRQVNGRSQCRLCLKCLNSVEFRRRILIHKFPATQCQLGAQHNLSKTPSHSLPCHQRTGATRNNNTNNNNERRRRRRLSSSSRRAGRLQLGRMVCLNSILPAMERARLFRHQTTSIPTTTVDKLRAINSSVGVRNFNS